MAREDLTTYHVYFLEDATAGRPVLLYSYQDEVGLTDPQVYAGAVARLNATINKINTPQPDSLYVVKGVVHPPAVSVRRQRYQDNTDAVDDGNE